MSTGIRVEITDFVAVATIDNPPVNALSVDLHMELTKIFDSFSDREDVRAVILTAAGKTFCAGADVKTRSTKPFEAGERWSYNRSFRECVYAIMECKKPVVAAINGPALGGGLGLVASCDILLAAETASIGLPEIDVGVLGGGAHAMRLFGHSLTRRMMLTGYRVPAAELYRLGVLEACVPRDELMAKAMEFARELAGKSPIAMKLAKRALNAIEGMTLRDGYRLEQDFTADLAQYDDSREAMLAFAERRTPHFKNR